MKEIVDEVLQEEENARRLVEQAKNHAQEALLKAKNEAQEFRNQKMLELKDSIRREKEQAERSFIAEKEKILQEARDAGACLRTKKEKDIPEIAKNIFSQIIAINE